MGYKLSKKLTFNANIANLFNSINLSEGTTRGDQFADVDAIDGTPKFGRRTLPFSVFTNLTYRF